MFHKICINNFKSLSMTDPLELKPLTILCGSNSSGKSSFIQSILMLSQSFSSRFLGESLILNGHLVKLGSFSDILKHENKEKVIKIKFSLPIKESKRRSNTPSKNLECDLWFGVKNNNTIRQDDEMHPFLVYAKYTIKKNHSENDEITDILEIKASSVSPQMDGVNYKVITFESSEAKRLSLEYPDFNIVGVVNDYGLVPTLFHIAYDSTRKKSYKLVENLIRTIESENDTPGYFNNDFYFPVSFIHELMHLIYTEREALVKSVVIPDTLFDPFKKEKRLEAIDRKSFEELLISNFLESQFSLNVSDITEGMYASEEIKITEWCKFIASLDERKKKTLIELLDKNRAYLQDAWYRGNKKELDYDLFHSFVFNEIRENLSLYFSRSVKYIGPLRFDPQSIHPSFLRGDQNDVGLKGEYTAALLHRNKNMIIRYSSPVYIDEKLSWEVKHDSLSAACKDWLCFLGVLQQFDTVDKGKLGYELRVKTDNNEDWQDLTHVGVGVSQVLPIILAFLLSNEDDILIFEQPELHLHPKIQSRLCDLFIIFSSSGRQCIIETHSEYIINRLRLRIVQNHDSDNTIDSALYFVNKNKGISTFKKISINNYGTIIDWPDDFFDQTDKEITRIMLEANKVRARQKSKKDNKFNLGWEE